MATRKIVDVFTGAQLDKLLDNAGARRWVGLSPVFPLDVFPENVVTHLPKLAEQLRKFGAPLHVRKGFALTTPGESGCHWWLFDSAIDDKEFAAWCEWHDIGRCAPSSPGGVYCDGPSVVRGRASTLVTQRIGLDI